MSRIRNVPGRVDVRAMVLNPTKERTSDGYALAQLTLGVT
jgi:hypothetical protein